MPDIREQNRQALAAIRVRRDTLLDSIMDLEQSLAAPSTARVRAWAADVAASLDRLRAVFDSHVTDTEKSGGLFEELTVEEPRLARAIDRMRADHVTIATTAEELSERLGAADDGADADAMRAAVLDLIRALLVHRHRGAELVYDAYNVDLSVGD
jgi:hypothetical protein